CGADMAWNQIWPVANVSWWMLRHNWVAPTLGHALGLPPAWSLVIPGLATAAALWPPVKSLFRGRALLLATTAVAAGIAGLAALIAVAPPLPDGGRLRGWLIHFLQG